MRRVVRPLARHRRVHAVGARPAVLVDVVAQMHHRVDPRQGGDRAIGVEVAVRVERAGADRQHRVPGRPVRQRPRAAERRLRPAGLELEGVGAAGIEPADVDLDRVVAVGAGHALAALAATAPVHRVEAPAVGKVARALRRDAGPQDHPVLQRIARGHAVVESRAVLRRGLGRARRRAQAQQGQHPAPVDPHMSPPRNLAPVSAPTYLRQRIPQENDPPCPAKPCTSRARSCAVRR